MILTYILHLAVIYLIIGFCLTTALYYMNEKDSKSSDGVEVIPLLFFTLCWLPICLMIVVYEIWNR